MTTSRENDLIFVSTAFEFLGIYSRNILHFPKRGLMVVVLRITPGLQFDNEYGTCCEPLHAFKGCSQLEPEPAVTCKCSLLCIYSQINCSCYCLSKSRTAAVYLLIWVYCIFASLIRTIRVACKSTFSKIVRCVTFGVCHVWLVMTDWLLNIS